MKKGLEVGNQELHMILAIPASDWYDPDDGELYYLQASFDINVEKAKLIKISSVVRAYESIFVDGSSETVDGVQIFLSYTVGLAHDF